MKKIVIVAGDKSGDLYGGLLSKKIKEKSSSFEIYSFGGEALAKQTNQVLDLISHSVCGLIEVLTSLKKLAYIFDKTLKTIHGLKPDLVILIDFPDFNLRLAKKLNKKYPLIYYVSPQVWAWRKSRINTIKKFVDKMVVIFQFEKEIYKKNGIDVLYFGHPLLEVINDISSKPQKIISFLPGSRKNEVKKHLPIMQKAKTIMEKELENYQFRIIKPPNLEKSFYENFSPNMPIIDHSHAAISESGFIITSSGTATIEISILGVPFIIIYRVNPLTWQILKRMVKIKHIGMVNILSSKRMVEELLQKEATPQKIAASGLSYLKNQEKYLALKNNLNSIKTLLMPRNAISNFAEFIIQFLEK